MSTSNHETHTATAPIQRLPIELIEHILSLVQNQHCPASSSLPLVSLVCKQWNVASRKVFWHSIRLTDANITTFSQAPFSRNSVHVKNLTLSTSATRWKRKKVVQSSKSAFRVQKRNQPDFKRLAARITTMEHLTTLAISENHMGSECCTSDSPRRLSQLLVNLPPSVKNLEVDIEVCPDCRLDTRICLSTVISRLMPQLEHLRLRIPVICPSLLAPAPDLRSISINLSWRSMYSLCRCQKHLQDMRKGARRPLEDVDDRSRFIAAAQSLLSDSTQPFPMIDHFVALSTHNFDADRCGPSHLLLKDDLIQDKTTAYPLWCINDEAGQEQELWALRRRDAAEVDDRDLVGKSTDLEVLMEGSPWVDSHHQVRIVNRCAADPAMVKSLIKPSLAQSLSTVKSSWHSCDLWEHERVAQACLLTPQTVPLGETPNLNMELYGQCGVRSNHNSYTYNNATVNHENENDNENGNGDDDNARHLVSSSQEQHRKYGQIATNAFDYDTCHVRQVHEQ